MKCLVQGHNNRQRGIEPVTFQFQNIYSTAFFLMLVKVTSAFFVLMCWYYQYISKQMCVCLGGWGVLKKIQAHDFFPLSPLIMIII